MNFKSSISKIAVAFCVLCLLASNLFSEDSKSPEIGKTAPDFTLKSVKGTDLKLSDHKGNIIVLEWTNYECPFVKKFYGAGKMQELQKTYTEKGVLWLSICSSGQGKQGHFSKERWLKEIDEKKSAATEVLLDEDGKVGKIYGAKTTPHIFIVDKEGNLAYMGAIDNIPSTKPEDIPNAKNYVSEALDALLSGNEIKEKSTKSYGCSVKYAD